MNEFDETKANINQDIDRVFVKVYREFEENYSSFIGESSLNDNLDYLRSRIKKDIPKKIKYKKILILDTLLNYLTKDARQILEGSDNKIINAFYDQNRNWIETTRNKSQHSGLKNSFSLSPNVSLIYGLLSGSLTFLIAVIVENLILKWGLFILIISIVIAFRVADFTYKRTIPISKQKIDEDVKRYIRQSQTQTKQELEQIIETYISNFEKFLEDKNLVKSEF